MKNSGNACQFLFFRNFHTKSFPYFKKDVKVMYGFLLKFVVLYLKDVAT